jgi:phage N-6-adenine-methyltransferase
MEENKDYMERFVVSRKLLHSCLRETPQQRDDGRDEWATPWREFNIICDIWKLKPTLDVAADDANTKCFEYITKEQDALKQTWNPINGVAWMNPPYSQPLMDLFIEKAIFESTAHGIAVMYLLPDWTDDKFFDLLEPFPHRFWRDPDQKPETKKHRIKFQAPKGIKASSPRHGNLHGVIDVWRRFV